MDKLENCADCGKKFGFTERIFSKTNGLWICEDCAITQMQENDNKDQKIADLEAKLEESKNQIRGFQEAIKKRDKKIEGLNKGLSKTQSKSYKIKQSKSQDIITIASQTEKERNLQKQLEDTIEQGICYQAEINQLKQQLAESEKALEDKNKLIIQEDGECLLCGDGYCINNDVAKITEENKKLKKQLELLDYEKTIKHYSLNRDLANPESEEMQKHLNKYVFKNKFRICCSMCGKTHEYKFKDIKHSDLFNDIYISCKSCPRSLNKLNFPEQAIAFYRTRYDLVCYEKHQDYLSNRNHISVFEEEINQLKQQLAEKDKELTILKLDYEFVSKEYDKLVDIGVSKFKQHEQQLAEKDVDLSLSRNEIDTLKHNLKVAQEHDNVMCEQYFEKCKKADQDKISFAVEKLEKVKSRYPRGTITWSSDDTEDGFEYVSDYIDQQIRVLKGDADEH